MIKDTMKCAVLDNTTLDINILELDTPQIHNDEVLVKIEAVGICGSDIHYYQHGKISDFIVNKPIILGHECSGVVVDVGESVTNLQVGDRVAVEPGVPCGSCNLCMSGNYNQCKDVEFLATPPYDGAFAQYIAHKAAFCFKIPESVSFEEATLVEPLSVGLHACKKIGIGPGNTVAIFGMGPIGLTSIIAAKSYGATDIIAVDFEKRRLDAALALGATKVICLEDEDAYESIMAYTHGDGVKFCMETAGAPKALQDALAVLGNGGKMAIIGLPPQTHVALNISSIADREVVIQGIFRYANTYKTGIDVIAKYPVNLDFLFTDHFSLMETKEAMDFAINNKKTALKVVVYPNKEEV